MVKSYIIRIYSSGKKFPNNFVGTVEPFSGKKKQAFSNSEELWNILTSTPDKPKPSTKGRKDKSRK